LYWDGLGNPQDFQAKPSNNVTKCVTLHLIFECGKYNEPLWDILGEVMKQGHIEIELGNVGYTLLLKCKIYSRCNHT
jgi:hypothetical protein